MSRYFTPTGKTLERITKIHRALYRATGGLLGATVFQRAEAGDLRVGSVTVEVAETPSRANFETYGQRHRRAHPLRPAGRRVNQPSVTEARASASAKIERPGTTTGRTECPAPRFASPKTSCPALRTSARRQPRRK